MAEPNIVAKTSTEYFTLAIDFGPKLVTGDKITECTISAINIANSIVSTNLVLGNSVGTIDSTKKVVSFLVRNGVPGEDYEIRFVCLTLKENRIEEKITLSIR